MSAVAEEIRGPALVLDNSGLMLVQGVAFVGWGALAEVLPLRATLATAGVVSVLAFGLFAMSWKRRIAGAGAGNAAAGLTGRS
jgi:hypothetical protein